MYTAIVIGPAKAALCVVASFTLLLLLVAHPAVGQGNASVFADGLNGPLGLEVDEQGRLWVAEQGTGNDDGRVSVVTAGGQVHPFLTGLPSAEVAEGELSGPNHLYLNDEDLWILQGEGTDPLSMSLLRISTEGFTPGDPPQDASDVEVVADVGSFVLGEGFAESNPYALAVGPDGDQFIVDAAANAIIRRAQDTGALSVFATFNQIPNPTPVGPPMIDPVPTGIVFTDNHFYVGSLIGFPFPEGAARIYEVDLDGNVSVFREGLTTIVDLAVDPRDGKLVALQFAQFSPPPPPPAPGFQPGTGKVVKLHEGRTETLADGLNLTPGLHFSQGNNLFVSSLFGQIMEVELNTFAANLAGYNEVAPNPFLEENFPEDAYPETVLTNGMGEVTAVLEEGMLHLTGSFSDLSANYTASHIHQAVAGVNGGVLVPLSPTLDADERGGTFDETAEASPELIAALLAGELYVNVHTEDHPGGEIRGQLLLAPNSAPAPVTDTAPAEGFSPDFTNEGNPSDIAAELAWSDVEDPGGDRVVYQLSVALNPEFDPLLNPDDWIVDDEGTPLTSFRITVGLLDLVLGQLGVEVGESTTFHLRVNSSDGSLRTLGEPLASTITRGEVGAPVADTSPPVCGPIDVENNSAGELTAVMTSASDEESGIAQVTFTRLVNLEGFLDGTGGYAEGDAESFDPATTETVAIRGERIDFSAGGVILTEVTNGAGLQAQCDPVVETLAVGAPEAFSLEASYPNPFDVQTKIPFKLAESSHVRLAVYDALGREVATLVDEEMDAGAYEVEWVVPKLSSGVYFYRIEAGSFEATRRMTLMK